jgi:RNA-directed DNA polymerase
VQEDGCEKDKPMENKPTPVPETAMQAGEIRARWTWVEPLVWTDRMLTALENGVKGSKWFSLIDKVYAKPTLRAGFAKVKHNAGSGGMDGQTVKMFETQEEDNLDWMQSQLRESSYRPKPVKRVWISKLTGRDKRPLGVPTVEDRVVQTALKTVLEPIFEKDFAATSYGFRPGRGCKDALRQVDQLLKEGYSWVVDADIKSYFDTIPHQQLMERIEKKVADGRVLELLKAFLEQGIMEGMKHWKPTAGTPQGAVISPLLANIYLDPLDWKMIREGVEMVRYCDDLVILCRSQEQAQQAQDGLRRWLAEQGLKLNDQKTRIVDATGTGGFDFLGYHFERGYRWPRQKSLKKLKDAIRAKTRRCNGQSLEGIIETINPTLRGWMGYFKHSHWTTFQPLDGWIRMRLRSILRKRAKRQGRGRGMDHQRWPNAFFKQAGLFSLHTAYASLC